MTTPLIDGLITSPWITTAEFLAAPTWLDNQDLVPGGNSSQQLNSLNDVLLKASGWASRLAEQNLAAHTVWGQDRMPVNKWGQVWFVPENNPVRQVTGFAYGSNPADLQVLANPSDPAQVWIEKQRSIMFQPHLTGTMTLSALQFGGIRPGAFEIFAQYTYVAGYCSTVLTQPATAGATQIYVADPTGLTPPISGGLLGTIPGSVARIWEPVNSAGTSGGEEAVQVASNWVAGTNPVLLASPLQNNHAVGAGIDELPPEVHQAVISLAVALLCRDDVSADEPYPSSFGPSIRESKRGGKAGGLVDHAKDVLHKYQPQVH